MSKAATVPEPEVNPEATPPEPQVRVETVKEYVVDTSVIDGSIALLKKAMESADEKSLPSIEAHIQSLEAQKESASTRADLAELADLRKKNFEAELSKILPSDLAVSEFLPKLSNEDRLEAARLIASQKKEPDAPTGPTEEQKAAWGQPLVPDGQGISAAEATKQGVEQIEQGDVHGLVEHPQVKSMFDEAMGFARE